MKRHHKILLGSFSTIVVVSLIVLAILLNGVIVKQTLENDALNKRISALEQSTNQKINDVTSEVINTKTSVENQIISLNQNITSATQQISKLKIQAGDDFSGIIKDVLGSIVIVRTLSSQGSGFFIANGYVVTNEHVIQNQNGNISSVVQIVTSDEKVHSAKIVGYIKDLDLTLIKTDEGYGKLTLEDSDNVGIGDKVIAIGTPSGLEFSATDGIVSATGRTGFGTSGTYIQTNAQLNPGNSGGPLINKNGNAIGMNNFKLVDTEGIGFALEADKIKVGVNLISEKLLNETLID